MDTAALERRLEAATSFAVGEPRGPALWKRIERAAAAVLLKEKEARRLRDFQVRCDAELNPADSETVAFEVVIVPPGPRVERVVVRVSLG